MARPSFDTDGFMSALTRAAEARGKTMKDVSVETGVSETTLSRMRSGTRACDAASLAALSSWAGINPARFSGHHQRPARSTGELPEVRLKAGTEGGAHG